ncbi:MAG: 50S ribosomal protein L30 [Cyanobacteria bacterium SZAS LIN-3]|nr:50S ribosomal protein L30 [Cyanobacteria bacterium SZAS LIN-3]
MLRVTLTKGLVGKKDTHKKVIQALGLRKYGSSVVHHDTPTIRGMVNKVHYLVTVTEEAGAQATAKAKSGKGKSAKAAAAKPAAAAKAPKAAAKAEAKAK